MELQVGEHVVLLRDTFPAGEFWDLPGQWTALDKDSPLEQYINCLRRFIVGWDFAGDPQDPAAWEALDVWRELYPIIRRVNKFAMELFIEAPKNSEPGHSSPAASPARKKCPGRRSSGKSSKPPAGPSTTSDS